MYSFICAGTHGWTYNQDVCDSRRHCAHYDVTGMKKNELLCLQTLIPRKKERTSDLLYKDDTPYPPKLFQIYIYAYIIYHAKTNNYSTWSRAGTSLRLLPTMGLLPDTLNCRLRMRRDCRQRFPRYRLQLKPLVSDPGMRDGRCVTHVPWCMSGLLTYGGGENVPGIPGACATRNFMYLVRGPLESFPSKIRYDDI